ncbi:glycosyltransferase [Paenibacillus solisilvae]|uniref:Glycosyltransferase n=1 Tax=Paenibacillus solisilvae TaxID=2486751 RepID=A0ABW0VWJ7_9BACL
MKIIYLVHQFYPEHYTGTEKFVLNMAKMSQRNQMKVKVITYSFQPIHEFDLEYGNIVYRNYVYQGIPVIAFRHKEIPSSIHYELSNKDVVSFSEHILQKEKPDLLHAAHSMRVAEFIKAAQRLSIPYLMTLTDFFLNCPKCILLQTDRNLCEGSREGAACKMHCKEVSIEENRHQIAYELLSAAQGVYAPSQFVASMMNKAIEGIHVEVLNHGMSYSKISKNRKHYSEGQPLTFFYGGSLTPHKGVHLIVEAFSKIESNRIKLMIYGSGQDKVYMNMLTAMVEKDERIEFKGVYTENDVSEIYNMADVAIVPSVWYENYPLVLHEALASNVPLIVSNVGGMSEKIKDDFNGYTFEIGNANDLKAAIEKFLHHPEAINRFKENIKTLMIPTIEQEAYAYERLYKSYSRA